MNRQILEGDALDKLKELKNNSIDLIATDPPYGYQFMNLDFDKAIIGVDTWKECLRVLKPGAFAFIMSAPRQDVLSHMIVNLTDAGFKTDFTSMYWAYPSGFPKAANISKLVDKKLNDFDKRKGTGEIKTAGFIRKGRTDEEIWLGQKNISSTQEITKSYSKQAKKLDGSYAGFQPKPAVEVILVCMKPLSEKNYTEQAMSNGKGISWFDDCRIPIMSNDPSNIMCEGGINKTKKNIGYGGYDIPETYNRSPIGRFPANLLVSDDALNDRKITKSNGGIIKAGTQHGEQFTKFTHDSFSNTPNDSGSFSRYFDLDAWEAQFIITPKASKSEKNKGLDSFIEQKVNDGRKVDADNPFQRGKTERKNTHPTVKPVSLFKYLITMGSREGDLILDPFMGSGTTAIACEQTARDWIGIEKNSQYVKIFKARLDNYKKQNKLEAFV